jgi:hypothetical protein
VLVVRAHRCFVVLSLELDFGIGFGIVRIIESLAVDYLFGFVEEFRQNADSEVSFGILEIRALMLNDMIWNFSRTKLRTVRYALFLTSADPDLAKIRILKLIGGNVGRLRKSFDEIRLAVGTKSKTSAVFGFTFGAEHNGR